MATRLRTVAVMSIAYTFRPDPARARALVVHPDDAADGWVRVDLPGTAAVLVCDQAAALLDGPGVGVQAAAEPYSLPAEFAKHREGILRTRLGGKTITDDLKVSIAELPAHPCQPARVRQGTYVDQQVTNELGLSAVLGSRGQVLADAAGLWTDNAGRILPLRQSRSANNLGVGLLALTADGHVLCGRRSNSVAVAAGRLDLTCSGSCDHPGSFPAHLEDYVAAELRRELAEEAGVPTDAGYAVSMLTVVRDLARGGKPRRVRGGAAASARRRAGLR